MILPRPIHNDHSKVKEFLSDKFECGESVEFCNRQDEKYSISCFNSNNINLTRGNKGRGRTVKIGIIDFYVNVTKDIGLINDHNHGGGGIEVKLTPTQWLLSGIDGTRNLDRLCLAWAKNGQLIPQTYTDAGRALKAILDESNQAIEINDNIDEAWSATEMIDNCLVKYNTYIDDLRRRSGL